MPDIFSSFGSRLPTKKAFKEAVESGRNPYLRDFSFFADNSMSVEDIEEGMTVGTVVGPDAERNRKWYANVKRVKGKLKVV